ncbi:hypothetical protein EZJ43_02105 [Pedobacter changchengzhani]|uniref:Uncharacterized protein n=1 Tax=Pedobacter changchengzhani TaxID=2529274 RepID=A0A4R5MQG0_9SPHI|nr:hypothetical protein [Pedobacter changchengzhani]TDG37906.1 hypothetical protein EZJ43_02105 [Pedobacter changchengzhani]
MEAPGKLTNVQLELLKLFQFNLPENQLRDIKEMLAKYFATAASNEMDKLWDENNWDENTIDSWKNEHLRKK